jgi:hypothetical protein
MGSAGVTDFTKSQNGGFGVQFDFFDIGFRVFFFLCIHSFDSGLIEGLDSNCKKNIRQDLQDRLDTRAFGRRASGLPQAKKIPIIL